MKIAESNDEFFVLLRFAASFSPSSVMFLKIFRRFYLTVDAGSQATLMLLSRIVVKLEEDIVVILI